MVRRASGRILNQALDGLESAIGHDGSRDGGHDGGRDGDGGREDGDKDEVSA